MTKVLRSLTNRSSVILMCVLLVTGCSQTPYSLSSGTSFVTSAFLPTGAIQAARVELHKEKTVIVCPGKGNANCKVNWRSLQEGNTAAEVANLLGQPSQRSGPDIYVEKVVAEWSYENDGVVYFENDKLRYVDTPRSFEYPN